MSLALAGLVACDVVQTMVPANSGVAQLTVPFVAISSSSYWAREPLALVGMERDLGSEDEQVLGLVNDTTLKGDNFLLFLAGAQDGTDQPAFRLDTFVTRAGGAPSPFAGISDRDLRSGSDIMGSYFWLEYRSGSQTNCVLAIRRLGVGSRILPGRANTMDVMLRNCVLGSIDLALAPILADRIGSAWGASDPASSLLMSPLAGPMP